MARRPIIESGQAQKVVYVSKAPEHLTFQDLDRYVDLHAKALRRELVDKGYHVTRVYRVLDGLDVKLIAKWELLGDKPGRKPKKRGEHVSQHHPKSEVL